MHRLKVHHQPLSYSWVQMGLATLRPSNQRLTADHFYIRGRPGPVLHPQIFAEKHS